MKITAHIITELRVAFGMYLKYEVKNVIARITKTPGKNIFCTFSSFFFQYFTYLLVYNPLNGVRTPETLFTALLEKDPETGIDCKKEPIKLQNPKVTISWVASRDFPCA